MCMLQSTNEDTKLHLRHNKLRIKMLTQLERNLTLNHLYNLNLKNMDIMIINLKCLDQ
ncbi:hypothetical protein LSH36_745g02045, partial [Paralvinella palmiformis]